MPGLHTNIGAKRARQAREKLGLDAVSPNPCILVLAEERFGLPVVVATLPDDIAGALYRNGAGSVMWVNAQQSVTRQRFTIAHELGHVVCEHAGAKKLDSPATIAGRTHDPLEVEANAFAAQLLAPRDGVRDMVEGEPNLEDVVRVAARFGISALAALYRFRTLEMVSTRRYEQLQREIGEKLHHDVWDYLAPEPYDDALSQIDERPRLPASLANSALAAVLRGEASVGAAAALAHCRADVLGDAAPPLPRWRL